MSAARAHPTERDRISVVTDYLLKGYLHHTREMRKSQNENKRCILEYEVAFEGLYILYGQEYFVRHIIWAHR